MRLIEESINFSQKSGLHNPFKNPQRYQQWGEVCTKLVQLFRDKEVNNFLLKSIQNVMPKSAV